MWNREALLPYLCYVYIGDSLVSCRIACYVFNRQKKTGTETDINIIFNFDQITRTCHIEGATYFMKVMVYIGTTKLTVKCNTVTVVSLL